MICQDKILLNKLLNLLKIIQYILILYFKKFLSFMFIDINAIIQIIIHHAYYSKNYFGLTTLLDYFII